MVFIVIPPLNSTESQSTRFRALVEARGANAPDNARLSMPLLHCIRKRKT